MTLSDISIKNPVFAWMLMIGIIVFGAISLNFIGISQLPDVDNPMISVWTHWEGAAPEVMETEVTDVLEGAVMGIQGVQDVFSSSSKGSSSLRIQFDLSKNVDVALQEVQSKIARVQGHLPRDMDPVTIGKSNPEDQPIMWITLTGTVPTKKLMEFTRDNLRDQFTRIPGVSEVMLGGFAEPSLRVWLNTQKMRDYELTIDDLVSAIGFQHVETPAGYIDTGTREFNLRVTGEANSVEEFSSLVIPARRGGSALWKKFTIGDVARVEDGLEDVRQISRTMDKNTVGVGIRKQRGTNSVAVARAVKDKIKEIQKYLPAGMDIQVRFDTTVFIEESIKEIYFIMFLSVVLTALVCWLFLGSFSSALNVFLTIPLSIFGSFFVINIMGFTLNTFTLLGLSLVVGIVVDDAIMMLENIVRHREEGESRICAAIKGAREITFAAIAATVAILAIFVPVIFMKGVIGKYFFQFGVTISAAVMISLLGALTLTPMYSAQFLKTGHTTGLGKWMDSFMLMLREKYSLSLKWCLHNRWKVIGGAFSVFMISLGLLGVLKKEFIPPQDQGRLNIRISTKEGSALEFTDQVVKKVEQAVMKHGEVETYYSNFGSNSGGVNITLKDRSKRPIDPAKKRPLTQQEFIPVLRKELKTIPGIEKVSILDLSMMGLTSQRGYPIEFTLNGPEWSKLAELSGQLKTKMEASGLMADVDSDYNIGAPEVRILPDRRKAAERGVSMSAIGNSISSMIGGLRAGRFTRGGRRYDILVQMVSSERSRPEDIKKILVRNSRGELIQLSDVVTVTEKPAMLSITRKNRERAIRMFANIAPGKSQGEALKVVEEIGKKSMPDGYKIVFTGSAQTFSESFNSLYIALILGIFVAYMVLGTQFNSFVHPVTVLLALPFSVSGAFFALLLAGQSLNIYSMIGLILLMGIVKKNSILLVDFTNQRRENKGMGVNEALLNACPIRLRPIIMTSVSTLAAAVPPALALGPGAETRVPMAVVILGGVFFSTLLTLFVVPCAYSLFSRFESKQHQKEVHEALTELEKM